MAHVCQSNTWSNLVISAYLANISVHDRLPRERKKEKGKRKTYLGTSLDCDPVVTLDYETSLEPPLNQPIHTDWTPSLPRDKIIVPMR